MNPRKYGMAALTVALGSTWLTGCGSTATTNPGFVGGGQTLHQFAYVATTGGIDLFNIGANGAVVGTPTVQSTGGKQAFSLTVTPNQKFVVATVATGQLGVEALAVFSINQSTGVLTQVTQNGNVTAGNMTGSIAVDPGSSLGTVVAQDGFDLQPFSIDANGQITLGVQLGTNLGNATVAIASNGGGDVVVVNNTNFGNGTINTFALTNAANPTLTNGAVDFTGENQVMDTVAVLADGSVGVAGGNLAGANNTFPFSLTGTTINASNTNANVAGATVNSASLTSVPNGNGGTVTAAVLTTTLGAGNNVFLAVATATTVANVTSFTTPTNIPGPLQSTAILPAAGSGGTPTILVLGTSGLTTVPITITNGTVNPANVTPNTPVADNSAASQQVIIGGVNNNAAALAAVTFFF